MSEEPRAAVTAYGFISGSDARAFPSTKLDEAVAWVGEGAQMDQVFIRDELSRAIAELR